jgi:Ca-activated chloride channel family protein
VDSVAVLLVVGVVALAGPAWDKQPSPWFSETAPLIIALEVSDSMRSNDVLPSRLERARFKILDLIEARTGARTALIVYSGSAHIVMPPTTDVNVIKPFLEGLDPAILPKPGSDITEVLPLALSLLSDETGTGTLLFVNDGFDAVNVSSLVNFANQEFPPTLAALVFGTEQGGVALMPNGSPVMTEAGGRTTTGVDFATLRQVEKKTGMLVEQSIVGDGDLKRLLRGIESQLRQADDPEAVWIDRAWWLTWPVLLLVLFCFRKGWAL